MKLNTIKYTFFSMALCLQIAGCKKFLEVEPDNAQVVSATVFADDKMATAAALGVYYKMMVSNDQFASGADGSVTALAGLTADELIDYNRNPERVQFEANELVADNSSNYMLWKSMYETIYQANAVLKGLSASTAIAPALKSQLQGEMLFVRAFAHFYLANLFGNVPLITGTDYNQNAAVTRTPADSVYRQTISDLLEAQNKLSDTYAGNVPGQRIRPNRATVTALLARIYLYTKDYANAEAAATAVIGNSLYSLEPNLDKVFLRTSKEAIWQLGATSPYAINGWDGYTFAATAIGPMYYVLNPAVVSWFENGDQRAAHWIATDGLVYWPSKYKADLFAASNPPATEASTLFRLAEQYLIRAEARAQQNKLTGANSAASDIDAIRSRAGLPGTTATTLPTIMTALEQEKRVELLTEWGHRWFDLKRWGRSTAVLSPVKPGWSPNDLLYPVPQLEISKNVRLKPQNPGY